MMHWLRTASPPRDSALAAIGILAGWGITHAYYLSAVRDLQSDARERKQVEALLLRGIESVGTIHYARDVDGKVTGIQIEFRGVAAASASASGTL